MLVIAEAQSARPTPLHCSTPASHWCRSRRRTYADSHCLVVCNRAERAFLLHTKEATTTIPSNTSSRTTLLETANPPIPPPRPATRPAVGLKSSRTPPASPAESAPTLDNTVEALIDTLRRDACLSPTSSVVVTCPSPRLRSSRKDRVSNRHRCRQHSRAAIVSPTRCNAIGWCRSTAFSQCTGRLALYRTTSALCTHEVPITREVLREVLQEEARRNSNRNGGSRSLRSLQRAKRGCVFPTTNQREAVNVCHK